MQTRRALCPPRWTIAMGSGPPCSATSACEIRRRGAPVLWRHAQEREKKASLGWIRNWLFSAPTGEDVRATGLDVQYTTSSYSLPLSLKPASLGGEPGHISVAPRSLHLWHTAREERCISQHSGADAHRGPLSVHICCCAHVCSSMNATSRLHRKAIRSWGEDHVGRGHVTPGPPWQCHCSQAPPRRRPRARADLSARLSYHKKGGANRPSQRRRHPGRAALLGSGRTAPRLPPARHRLSPRTARAAWRTAG